MELGVLLFFFFAISKNKQTLKIFNEQTCKGQGIFINKLTKVLQNENNLKKGRFFNDGIWYEHIVNGL